MDHFGCFERVNFSFASGWVSSKQGENQLIRLLINGLVVCTTTAEENRLDVPLSYNPRGFRIDIKNLKIRDFSNLTIEKYVAESDSWIDVPKHPYGINPDRFFKIFDITKDKFKNKKVLFIDWFDEDFNFYLCNLMNCQLNSISSFNFNDEIISQKFDIIIIGKYAIGLEDIVAPMLSNECVVIFDMQFIDSSQNEIIIRTAEANNQNSLLLSRSSMEYIFNFLSFRFVGRSYHPERLIFSSCKRKMVINIIYGDSKSGKTVFSREFTKSNSQYISIDRILWDIGHALTLNTKFSPDTESFLNLCREFQIKINNKNIDSLLSNQDIFADFIISSSGSDFLINMVIYAINNKFESCFIDGGLLVHDKFRAALCTRLIKSDYKIWLTSPAGG